MSDRKAPTNADIMSRLADVEEGLVGLQAGQTLLTERVNNLEHRWDTVQEMLSKTFARMGDQGARLAELVGTLDQLGEKIDSLACSPLRKRE